MISNVAIEITEINILNKTRVDFLVIGIIFLNNIAKYNLFRKLYNQQYIIFGHGK